jgi:HK97 family phage prohead protease
MTNEQLYFGAITKFDEVAKTVTSNILHFDIANENRWTALTGSLDSFLIRLNKSKKYVPAFYQHKDDIVIGLWKELTIKDSVLSGTLHLSDIPFVRDVVIPQLKEGTLQGASPTIASVQDTWNQQKNIYEIIEGILCEASIVGLPADLKADILNVQANIKAQENKRDFEFELLTL